MKETKRRLIKKREKRKKIVNDIIDIFKTSSNFEDIAMINFKTIEFYIGAEHYILELNKKLDKQSIHLV